MASSAATWDALSSPVMLVPMDLKEELPVSGDHWSRSSKQNVDIDHYILFSWNKMRPKLFLYAWHIILSKPECIFFLHFQKHNFVRKVLSTHSTEAVSSPLSMSSGYLLTSILGSGGPSVAVSVQIKYILKKVIPSKFSIYCGNGKLMQVLEWEWF